jgi:hypothetical protein
MSVAPLEIFAEIDRQGYRITIVRSNGMVDIAVIARHIQTDEVLVSRHPTLEECAEDLWGRIALGSPASIASIASEFSPSAKN